METTGVERVRPFRWRSRCRLRVPPLSSARPIPPCRSAEYSSSRPAAPSLQQAFQRAANIRASALPMGRCGAPDGISSGSSPTGLRQFLGSRRKQSHQRRSRVVAGDEFACALLGRRHREAAGALESPASSVTEHSLSSSQLYRSRSAVSPALLLSPADTDTPVRSSADTTRAVLGRNGRRPARKRRRRSGRVPVLHSRSPSAGSAGAIAIATGAYHTCAVLGDRTVRCWGRNDQAQLGDGTRTTSSRPRRSAASPMSSRSAAAASTPARC